MYSIRKWIFKPKKNDQSVLAQFFYADEELNLVAAELDSFDGRKDPERCTALVNQLRVCQDKVLGIVERIMEEVIPLQRANRDFRVKFPDDVLQESLAGQLWFGAECLAAGSSIMNREVESASMRPLAKALTRHLDYLRSALRDQCLRNINIYTDKIKEALVVFDRLFAEFELSYVSAMVPVKSMKEYDIMQDVIVLFCETTLRALRLNLLTQDMIDDYDPAIMFTIPRLAIVCGLLVYPEGPLNPDMDPMNMSEMFRPFQTLLYKIRELLWTLSKEELWLLEKSLCSAEEPGLYRQVESKNFGEDDSILDGCTIPPAFYANYPDVPAVGSVTHISQSESGNHLSVERLEYFGTMSNSTSTMTVVANPNFEDLKEVENELKGEGNKDAHGDNLGVDGNGANITHQDSNDSGMLSENGSISEITNPVSLFEPSGSADMRTLRHSLSWPESSHYQRQCRRSQSDTLDDDLGEDSPSSFACPGGSHEFNFHLPLNTQSGDSGTEPKTIPVISVEHDIPPVAENGLSTRRIFITSESSDDYGEPGGSGTEGQRISFVTDTLNEVFVTDVAFRVPHSVDANGNPLSPDDKSPEEESPKACDCPGSSTSLENCRSLEESGCKAEVSNAHCNDIDECRMCQNEGSGDMVGVESTSVSDQPCQPNPTEGTSASTEGCQEGDLWTKNGPENKNVDSNQTTGSPAKQSSSDLQMDINHFEEKRSLEQTTSQDLIITPSGDKRSSRSGCTHPACSTCPDHSTGSLMGKNCLEVPQIKCMKYGSSAGSNCSSRSHSPSVASVECDWDRESYASSETSSYNSECHDDEEIALAIQAAELAARREARSRFKSSGDLIHRLFVCISGVADQLQTNYASDLRHILKAVFEGTASEPFISMDAVAEDILNTAMTTEDADGISENGDTASISEERNNRTRSSQEPPPWVPDDQSPHCTTCKVPFTFVRRRHHCRNCGKIFCGRCSSNAVPLPHYGHAKPVRVCNHCFMFQVTPFTVNE